ncbi:MAG: serine/threonine-protein kinase [Planctomycetota bacterium]
MDTRNPPSRDDLVTQAEELLAQIVDLAVDLQQTALEELCREHPSLALELRELWSLHRKLLGPPDPTNSADGEPFGPFQLLRPLGSGGMGTVWLARQRMQGVDRLVAVKTVRSAGLFSKESRERFRREARALFRVDHPGICPIYDVGDVEGTPYLAMRYVPGQSLAEIIADARASKTAVQFESRDGSTIGSSSRAESRGRFDGVLSVLESIARALHAAHETGLVHRDVKPGNVIITPTGEPVLLDFGLARTHGEDSDLTVSGAPVGTPAYMSPEQVSGKHSQIDRTTDVWSLAVTAYECLTLETPFRAETREAVYRRILTDDPAPLRRFDRSWPRDLDVVISTALRKEPDRRYRTALEFAEDLAAVRRMLPTRARHTGMVERTRLWMRRNPVVSALLVLLALALGTAVVFAVQASDRAAEAERSRKLAEDSFAAARTSIEQVTDITRTKLDEVPGFASQLTVMLQSCVDFYTKFAELRESDPRLGIDVARAWQSIGEIENAVGRFAESEAAFRLSRQHLEKAEADGFAIRDSATMVFLVTRLGALAARQGRIEEGKTRLAEAVAIAARGLATSPRDLGRLNHALNARTVLCNLLIDSGEDDAALKTSEEAIRMIEALPADLEKSTDLPVSIARTYDLAAKLETRFGRAESADQHFANAITWLENLPAAMKEELSAKALLSIVHADRGELRKNSDRLQDALEDTDRSITLNEQIVASHPDHYQYTVNLGGAYANRGGVLVDLGKFDDAAKSLERGRELLRKVLETHPRDQFITLQLAIATLGLGDLGTRRREMEEAAEHYREVLRVLDALDESTRGGFDELRLRARAASSLGTCLISALEFEAAEQSLAAAATVLDALIARSPATVRLLVDKATLLHNRALAAAGLDRQDAAAGWFQAAAETWLKALPQHPQPPAALLQTSRDLARECLARMFEDTTVAHQAALEARRQIDAVDEKTRSAVVKLAAYQRDLWTLRFVAAVGDIGTAPQEARKTLLQCAGAFDRMPRERDKDWMFLLAALCRVSALRCEAAADPSNAEIAVALTSNLQDLATGELPPFPDLAHLCEKALAGARAIAATLEPADAAPLVRSADAVQKRLDGQDH